MERNREGRRGGGAGGSASAAPRRPRVSGPKDASDEDERMDDTTETRPWERPKKERINSFHLSVSGNPRNKRKRQGPQEAQLTGRSSACDDADESAEETENAASEDDDEPPPPPILRRPGKSRGNGKVKSEDEIVMDIPAVPRKARSLMSSSSRFTPDVRRQPEPLPSDSSRQQSPVAPQTSLNGISSSNIHGKPGRRLKSGGAKIRGIKIPKVSEPTTISDKEVEVAEALFDLARSLPSHSGTMLDQKPETKLEPEVVKAGSPPHVPALSPASVALPNTSGPGSASLQASGSNANGNAPSQVQNVILPTAEAPKRKRPRIALRQEECRAATPIRPVAPGGGSYSSSPSGVMHSPVGEAEHTTVSEKSQSLAEEGLSQQHPEPLKVNFTMESSHPVTQLHDCEDSKINSAEHRSKAQVEPKESEENLQYNLDMHEWNPDSRISSPLNVKVEPSADASESNDGCVKLEFPSRSAEFYYDNDGNSSKLKIDLMAPPMKLPLKEDTAPDASVDQHILSEDISINLTSHLTDAPRVKVEHSSDSQKDGEDVDTGLKEEETTEESRKIKERAENMNKEQKEEQEQMSGQLQKEQMPSLMQRERATEGEREKDRDSAKLLGPGLIKTPKTDTGTLATSSFLMSTFPATASSSAPVALAGWMPPFGYYGSGAPPWAAGASLPGANVDGKTAHQAVQLPHIAVLPPVPRMNNCASHVYLAHFIYREQQHLRHTMWPATLCRGTPYNLNIPPVNMHEKEKMGATHVDPARKASTQQAGLSFGFSVSQSSGAGVTVSSGTLGVTAGNSVSAPSMSSAGAVSVEAGSGTTAGNVMSMAHAQYLQAMMQPNGFPPFSFPLSGPPGQAAQYFNSPFYPAHLMPTLPQLQSLAQQAPNMQKQQQGLRTVPHSSSSQLLPPPQQQLQLQLAPQSPPNSQQPQHHHHHHHQHHHHMGTSTQQFGTHSEEDSTVGGESHSTADSRLSAMQRSMCGQSSNLPNLNMSPASLMLTASVPAMPSHHQDVSVVATLGGKHTSKSQSVQQQQLIQQNPGPGSGLHMKGLDPSISQGYSPMTLSNVNRGPVGPSPLGLVSVASVMATQGHAVLPGASENPRVHGQQQQVHGGQNQQYHQRAVPRAPASVSEDTFAPSGNKGRDFIEDRKSSVKQIGGPLNLTRDMEVSSPSVQGSPTSGNSAPAPRMANNLGRTLNLTDSTGARNPRPVSLVGTGQVPHLQSQTSKQSMARTKGIAGANISQVTAPATVSSYAMPGNLGKFQGTGLPFAGQMTPCSQGLKQGPTTIVKVGQRSSQGTGIPAASNVPPQAAIGTSMTKNPVPQGRSNQQGASTTGTPPRMPPGSTPMLPSGPLSLSTSHSQSVLKAAGVPVSKSPSNGKGTVPTSKSGPVSVKRSSVSGPALSSVVGPGQNMSAKSPSQQKNHGQLSLPQFSQQQSTVAAQHQQLGPKHQVYHQQQPQQGSQFKQSFPPQAQYRPQPFLQQHHQQYLQHPPLQQQSLSQQQAQQPSSHCFHQNPQNSGSQHGHTHQHLRHDQHHLHLQQQSHSMSMSSSSATTNNALSLSPPNLTLGTGMPGNSSVITNTDGADQCQGPSSRSNSSKAASSPGNQLSSGGIPKNNTALHPSSTTLSGQQIGNPHSGSSHYLQLAPVLGVKSTEQKTVPECVNREEFSGIRHLPSSSNSQPPLVSNPSTS